MIFWKGKKICFLWILCIFLQNCSSSYAGRDVYGADEFVLDSYKIQEGKFSILEMQGDVTDVVEEEKSKEIKGNQVHLIGLVQHSTVELDKNMRLFDVLSKAKISPHANLFGSYLVREKQIMEVDFFKLLKKADMSQNILVKGSDRIYIASACFAKVIVMGEVGCKKAINLPDGFISLREAIAQAGGISYTGDKSYIQIVRAGILKPKIYVLNWKHVLDLPNNSLLLMPGDMVYVASKPITEWGRFISQLIPFFNVSFNNNCFNCEKSD